MKHFRRWMICLSFLLNTALFITLIILAAVKAEPVFLAISLVCYPLSLLIIFLARKYINSNCKFYGEWISEHIAWRIIKTILMPIVASGALIMHHLITITYTRMNEAIEDKTGFSLSSIGRTCQVCLTYFIASILVFAIAELCGLHKDDVWREALESIEVSILVLGGIVWLLDTIFWDILDFADKESDAFIKFKNISFLVIGVLCVLFGLTNLILCEAKDVFEYFGNSIVPICIHFCYYGVIRSGQVPQSKMRYFWGPISIAVVFTYSALLLNIVAHGRILALLVYLLTVIAFAVVIHFVGVPFMATDGTYRLDYRKLNGLYIYNSDNNENIYNSDNNEKDKKSNGKNKGDDDKDKKSNGKNKEDDDKDKKSNGKNKEDDDKKIIPKTMSEVANNVRHFYTSGTSTFNISPNIESDIKIDVTESTKDNISYKVVCDEITLDFRGCKDSAEEKYVWDEFYYNYEEKITEIKTDLINQTYNALQDKKIDIDKKAIEVDFKKPEKIKELRL